ncbi:MAG: hypothetical protein GY749_21135 [Desulfobacteraceae bacterium]|nr:hypothetical protein [Desulfobacteraceae bacterium]
MKLPRSHALRGNAARTLRVPAVPRLCVPAFQTFPDAERPDCIPTQSVGTRFCGESFRSADCDKKYLMTHYNKVYDK